MNEDLRKKDRYLGQYTRHNEASGGGENTKVAARKPKIPYTVVQSDISFHWLENNVTRSEELNNNIALYDAVSERQSKIKNQNSCLKISEGKSKWKNNCIQTCKNIRKKQQKSYFAHLLLVLDCNLMRRYENWVAARMNHISIRLESLVYESKN